MPRINGSLPAAQCVEFVSKKLAKYNLVIGAGIVCITTDGARVMIKVGKLYDAEQELCYAHAIHLAVTDILYKKSKNSEKSGNEVENSEKEEENSESEEDFDEEESDNEGLKITNHDKKKLKHTLSFLLW